MKKCYKHFIIPFLVVLNATTGFTQEQLVVEYESSPPPNSIIAILIGLFTPDDFDFNGDGKRDIVVRVGNTLVVRTFSQPDNMVFNAAAAGISLDDYLCLGFHDIGGGVDKELVLVPKSFTFGDIIISSFSTSNNQFVPSFSWGSWTPPGNYFFGVENTDGDAQSEILAAKPGEQFYVLGQGFTPGLTGDSPTEKFKVDKPSEKALDLLQFEIQLIAPPNFRWPGNFTYIEPGSQDLNYDNINDYGSIKFEGIEGEIIVINGADHETIYEGPLPNESLSFNFNTIGYFDVTGEGYKHIMIGGSNSGSSLRDMEIILWLNPQTNEVNTSLLPFLEQGFRVVSIGNPFGFGGSVTVGIIMQHMTTGRVIVVGDGQGLQGGGNTNGFTLPEVPDADGLLAYSLNMVYESQVPVQLMMPTKGLYNGAELDVNADGTVDIPCLVLQDSVGSEMAGFTVLDGDGFEPIWETTIPTGTPIDPNPFFHGFFDANGDGQKEIIFGAETVQTHDSEIHKPFGPGFEIKFIYDLDADGFEEIIGTTPEGKVQVWSSNVFVNAAFEQQMATMLGLEVSPNPCKDEALLRWNQPVAGPVFIETIGREGQVLQQLSLPNVPKGEAVHRLQLSQGLPNGLYFARLLTANGLQTIKFVVGR